MEELNKDIKRRVEKLYIIIQAAKDELDDIRENQCIHVENSKTGTTNVTTCSICGKILEDTDGYVSSFSSPYPEYYPSQLPQLELADYIKNMSIYWMNEKEGC